VREESSDESCRSRVALCGETENGQGRYVAEESARGVAKGGTESGEGMAAVRTPTSGSQAPLMQGLAMRAPKNGAHAPSFDGTFIVQPAPKPVTGPTSEDARDLPLCLLVQIWENPHLAIQI